MNRHRQIITLQVDFDLRNTTPPEKWEWDLMREHQDVEMKLLAASAVETRPTNLDTPAIDELTKRMHALTGVLDGIEMGEELEQEVDAALQSIREFVFDESFVEALGRPEMQATR
jgi:hypothetical protein